MNPLGNPTLRLFIGAALISLSPVWVKLVSVSATSSAFWRLAIGGSVIALYLLVTRQKMQLSRRVWQILVLAALFLALDLFQVFVMAAAGFVILREPPSARQLVAIPLAVFGLALIVGVDWNSLTADYRTGILFGLGAAVTYAGYLLVLRHSRQASSNRIPSREIAVISLTGAAVLGAASLFEGGTLAITRGDGSSATASSHMASACFSSPAACRT